MKHIGLIVGLGCLLLLGVVIGVGVVAGHAVFGAIEHGGAIRSSLLRGDVATASREVRAVNEHIDRLQFISTPFRWITIVPYFGDQVGAAYGILDATDRALSAVGKLTDISTAVSAPLRLDAGVSFGSLSEQDRLNVLGAMQRGAVSLQGVRSDISLARLLLADKSNPQVWTVLREGQGTMDEVLLGVQEVIDHVGPQAELLLTLGGVSKDQTYLFLLQNNGEMRGTGGFIGTYGVVTVRNAAITSFRTDNVYNLDDPNEKTLSVRPPEPIAKYFKTDKWFFRDSNWSPDFAESARQALWFYDKEGGKEKFDGVIAMTQDAIIPYLKIVGPITVEGETYTAENFEEKLEYQVEMGFYKRGIPESQRKEVVGVIARQILERLLALPSNRWNEVGTEMYKMLAEKHMLVYLSDQKNQQLAEQLHWAGRVEPTKTDFLMVADSNMVALKTDLAMQKSIQYTVRPSGSDLMAQVKLTYKNTGKFSWLTTRYRDWVRVYVPQGAVLTKGEGFISDETKKTPTRAQVSTELGKTVFAGYFTVEPGESKVITLEYKLPASVRQSIQKGAYHLFAQKQSGVPMQGFVADIVFPRAWRSATPSDGSTVTTPPGTQLKWQADLYTDRELTVGF